MSLKADNLVKKAAHATQMNITIAMLNILELNIFPTEYTTSEESDVQLKPKRSPSTWLVYTVKRASFKNITKYINQGADVNYQIKIGDTPLFLAVKENWASDKETVKAVNILLKAGADPNIGYPLAQAAMTGKSETFKALLEAGVNINTMHPHGSSPFLIAGSDGSCDIVKMAIEHKPKINLNPTVYFRHPYDANDYSLMMIYAAGEKYAFFNTNDKCLPYAIFEERKDMTLKNLCRRAIRAYTTSITNDNLFEMSSQLDIPKSLQSYLVFDLAVRMSIEDFYQTYLDVNEVHPDADDHCVENNTAYTEDSTNCSTDDSEYPDSVYSNDDGWLKYRKEKREKKEKETEEEKDDDKDEQEGKEEEKNEEADNEAHDEADDEPDDEAHNEADDEADDEVDDEADDEADDERDDKAHGEQQLNKFYRMYLLKIPISKNQ